MLDVYAGAQAQATIKKYGFTPEIFSVMLGASGGPKWFVLAGLDRVIVPEFLCHASRPVDIVGTSAGAFRTACLTQRDPRAAINRLAHHYSRTTYSEKPSPTEISESARDILQLMLGEQGISEILNNKQFKAHFITARSKGLDKYTHKYAQMLGLICSAMGNTLSRKTIKSFYERVTFGVREINYDCPAKLGNTYVPLNENNLEDALVASGSIPLVMDGVRNITGAPTGMYRDGGIIDYHFDFSVQQPVSSSGLVLYPHFYKNPIPGWFDKGLPYRKPHTKSYDNVVMLVPSDEFIAKLPYGKISDRNDFINLDVSSRLKYWQIILSETDRLGELFMQWSSSDEIIDKMQDFHF
jgi:hypothetical protein